MFNDRYMPIDANDDYELTREEPGRHSHKHDRKHKKSKKERHREGSRERHRHREGKVEQEGQTERLPTTQAADELEDGEIMEDGEVQEAPQQVNSGRPSNADEEADRLSEQRRSSSPNGDTRKRQRSSSRAPTDPGEKSVSQDHSQDAAAIASRDKSKEPLPPVNSSRDRRNSRERSTSRRRDREQLLQDERPPRHGSRDYPSSGDTAVRSDSRQHDRSDRDRDRHRDRDRDRERGRYDRDRERYEQYDRERVDRDRHRADSRAHDDRRRRISRSRSRDRRAGAPRSFEERERERAGAKSYEEREKERNSQKRSRDDRDRGEDGKRHRRSHSSDEELPDLPDPDSLTVVDALGLTAAEREAEEEQKRLEESRRRRQEILAKHQQAATVAAPTATAAAANGQPVQQQQPEQQQKPEQNGMGDAAASTLATEAAAETDVAAKAAAGAQGTAPLETAAAAATDVQDGTATPEGERSSSDDSQNAPGPVLDIWNKGQDADGEVSCREVQAAEEPTSQLPVHLVAQTEPNMQSERLRVGGGGAPGGGQKAAADDDAGDMFAADDDMFAAEGDAAVAGPKKAAVPAGLQDNYDDAEGYYNFQVGEVLDSRYEVFACKGKGVFSTVLRARDLLRYINTATGQLVAAGTVGAEHPEVAIKVIRSNETMSKAAALEQRILRMLSEKDPDSKKHVIRLLRTFEFRQHVCMVFEPMDMNLRELTLKYGRNVGLNITAVAIYASQLLVALRHLQQCRILHADIKPDNILVNARRSKVKICDLGSAMLAGENERTPYLVSRFYRAPEVILGLAYDFSMDMWSVGCVLYELFTGKILFPGRTNNEMLKLMMDVKGPFPKKMLKKGIFVEKHFEDDVQTSFALIEEDPVTKQPVRRVISNPTAKHNFAQLLTHSEGDRAQVTALADLLERMCALDPEKRIDPDAALRHPFIKPWLPKKKSGAGH